MSRFQVQALQFLSYAEYLTRSRGRLTKGEIRYGKLDM
jgi:hypothetical protein